MLYEVITVHHVLHALQRTHAVMADLFHRQQNPESLFMQEGPFDGLYLAVTLLKTTRPEEKLLMTVSGPHRNRRADQHPGNGSMHPGLEQGDPEGEADQGVEIGMLQAEPVAGDKHQQQQNPRSESGHGDRPRVKDGYHQDRAQVVDDGQGGGLSQRRHGRIDRLGRGQDP